MIPYIGLIRQLAQQCDLFDLLFLKGKYLIFILQQNNSFFRRAFCQLHMLFAAQNRFIVRMAALSVGIFKGKDCTHDAQCGIVDAYFAHQAVFDRLHQLIPEKLGAAHFHILAAVPRFCRILYSPYEIAHDKAVKIPFFLQHLAKQIIGMSAVDSLIKIVGAHNTRRPGIHTLLEMRQINLSFGTSFTIHTHLKTADLHGIKRIMLHTGHDILILYASYQRRSHTAQGEAVFPVDLLAASPAGIIRQIDTYACKQVSAVSSDLTAYGVPDFLLQLYIKAGAAAHRYRKTGAFPCSAHNPSGPVTEKHGCNPFLFISSCRIRLCIIVRRFSHRISHHIL